MKKDYSAPDAAATGQSELAAPARFGDKLALAQMIGMSRRSVDNLIAQGCSHLKLGKRRVRFDLPEVAAWLKEQFGTQRRGKLKQTAA